MACIPSDGCSIVIFADGFETGDTSRWSKVFPPCRPHPGQGHGNPHRCVPPKDDPCADGVDLTDPEEVELCLLR